MSDGILVTTLKKFLNKRANKKKDELRTEVTKMVHRSLNEAVAEYIDYWFREPIVRMNNLYMQYWIKTNLHSEDPETLLDFSKKYEKNTVENMITEAEDEYFKELEESALETLKLSHVPNNGRVVATIQLFLVATYHGRKNYIFRERGSICNSAHY